MAADPSKLQTQIDIKPPPLPFHAESAPETLQEPKLSFFASRYRRTRRRRADTWLISLFVILHIVAFTATMVVNDCWHKSGGDCAFKAFGRLSFQPLSENPLLGPSASTWVWFSRSWLQALIFVWFQKKMSFLGEILCGFRWVLSVWMVAEKMSQIIVRVSETIHLNHLIFCVSGCIEGLIGFPLFGCWENKKSFYLYA